MTKTNTGDIWLGIIATFKAAPPGVQASSRSDTLSDSRPSATSNHTVVFTVNNAVYGSSLSKRSALDYESGGERDLHHYGGWDLRRGNMLVSINSSVTVSATMAEN